MRSAGWTIGQCRDGCRRPPDFADSSGFRAPALTVVPGAAAQARYGMHAGGRRCLPPKYSVAGKLRRLAGGKAPDGVVARIGARRATRRLVAGCRSHGGLVLLV